MTIAILDRITHFLHFDLIAHHGIERREEKRLNRNGRYRQTNTELNNRKFVAGRGDVACHSPAESDNLGGSPSSTDGAEMHQERVDFTIPFGPYTP